VVSPEELYQNDYPYETSITKTARTHFNSFAGHVVKTFGLGGSDLVVDIGSNVGVLLSGFKSFNVQVLGVDPAPNIAQIAEKNGIPTMVDFFSKDVANYIVSRVGRARVITGSNVFAHIDDLYSLMEAVDCLLDDEGVFIIEAPYFLHLLENLEYDTIYHEHLSYLSLTPLIPFFKRCGFEIFDVMEVSIHGGSLRMFISREGKMPVTENVANLLSKENEKRIHSTEKLMEFARRVEKNREDLVTLLRTLKQQGKRVAAVSAPAKGMTLLNYCRIGKDILDFITEKSELKIGRFAPGTHIPVLPDRALIDNDIDYALLLAWNFKEEIIRNLKEFTEKGGRFIVPIPEVTIV
jgi:hypothetical protein